MLTQPEGLIAWIAMEMTFEITAELRGAGVADLHRDRRYGSFAPRDHHARLVQAHGLDVLHGRTSGESLESGVVRSNAHPRSLSQGGNGEFLVIAFADL